MKPTLIFLLAASVLPGAEPAWQSLFDGKTLAGWAESGFEGVSSVKVEAPFRGGPGAIVIEAGTTLSGVTSTRGSALPRTHYEITLEAMRLAGGDFFCGLTFPVGKSACSFIVGGWGGILVGISSVDYSDASDNETTKSRDFEDNRWYRIRVRVTDVKIEAWIDTEQMVELELKDRKVMMRPGDIEKSQPLGLATFMTRAAIRDIRLRRLTPAEIAEAAAP
ncbi:MAG: DUF1080 domain-containing protein [Opitutaceae bacterium]|nr:DUF1080 domain-containing protein [Opitutaceae bacterium]